MRILAIDLGQDKSVFCDFDSQTGEYELGVVVTYGNGDLISQGGAPLLVK